MISRIPRHHRVIINQGITSSQIYHLSPINPELCPIQPQSHHLKTTALVLLASTSIILAQGPLTPPAGPIAPTMKTQTQIEPRTDISTVSGTSSTHHSIVAAGSYYLTGNLEVTRVTGISIESSNVTLDLNGFTIYKSGASSFTGRAIDLSLGSGASF